MKTSELNYADTVVVILGGGQGSRLYPLTKVRSKPAVPIGGKYRLIDIPVSNAINSKMDRIFILTQFNSQSLNSHVTRTYRFDTFSDGFVEILAAEQTEEDGDWYQGTADAVRKHLHRFISNEVDNVLILGGDHLYRMDYRQMLTFHADTHAAITVATIPVAQDQVSSFGVMKINEDARITEFLEKPGDEESQRRMRCPKATLQRLGFQDPKRGWLASMGIYLFRADVLREVLADRTQIDFGKHVIPDAIHRYPVFAHIFDGYWEDIGTMRAFYEANIDLAQPSPNFRFYQMHAPIYTRPRFLPGSKVYDCRIHNSIIGEGCLIRDSVIENSVIGIRGRINHRSTIRRSVLLGADFYEGPMEWAEAKKSGLPPLGIGEDVTIENAIIDKNARIGDGSHIANREGIKEASGDNFYIRDGIVVIPKNAVVKPDTII